MAQVTFAEGHGHIEVALPANKFSPGVENPGQLYMDTAHSLLKAIQQYLLDYGALPAVEDVALHLKDRE